MNSFRQLRRQPCSNSDSHGASFDGEINLASRSCDCSIGAEPWRQSSRGQDVQSFQLIGRSGNGFLGAVEGVLLTLELLTLTMTFGCLAAAAPLASGILRAAASGISSSARADKNNQAAQNAEPCDMGERPLPRLIELKTDNLGTTMYRPLNPGGPAIDPQLQHSVGQIGDPGAWRDMGDLAGAHFQPSLQSKLTPGSVIFLAYAPIQVRDPSEQSQLDALNHDFGTSGIFDWDNRVFLYSAVHQLPCESSRLIAPTKTPGKLVRPESPEQPEAPH